LQLKKLNDPFRYVKDHGVSMNKRVISSGGRRTSIGARRNPAAQAAILQAARHLLAAGGYSGFSIDEVARRAGAGKPTIYRWWPTKADLFVDVFAAEKAAAIPIPNSGDLVRDLTRYTTDLWRFWRSNPAGGALRGLIAEAQASEAALATLRNRFLPERLEPVRTIFEQASARADLPAKEIEDRVVLWVALNWFRLLTDQIDEDASYVRRMMVMIAK
jgi:AcrR family transcriptional regulator